MTISIFVGNIAYGAMEKEIHDLFADFGSVHGVRFIMDYNKGRFRGFGFVTMLEEDAHEAIRRLNEKEFQGRRLIVKKAQHTDASEP